MGASTNGSLRGVLLDVDGTLIDSNDAHTRSWLETLAEFGYARSYEQVRPLIGEGGDKLVRELTGLDVQQGKGKQLTERRAALFHEKYLPTLHAFSGAHDLVARLRAEGLRLVVATSAKEQEMEALLEQAGLPELIDRSTSSDDAGRSKPDPDIVRAALHRGHLTADQAVMIGDTPYDIEAAGRAGIDAIVFRCGGWWSDDALSGAVAIYDGPEALLRDLDRRILVRLPRRGT